MRGSRAAHDNNGARRNRQLLPSEYKARPQTSPFNAFARSFTSQPTSHVFGKYLPTSLRLIGTISRGTGDRSDKFRETSSRVEGENIFKKFYEFSSLPLFLSSSLSLSRSWVLRERSRIIIRKISSWKWQMGETSKDSRDRLSTKYREHNVYASDRTIMSSVNFEVNATVSENIANICFFHLALCSLLCSFCARRIVLCSARFYRQKPAFEVCLKNRSKIVYIYYRRKIMFFL